VEKLAKFSKYPEIGGKKKKKTLVIVGFPMDGELMGAMVQII
jgi:hypothetical protein